MPKTPGQFNPGDAELIQRLLKYQTLIPILQGIDVDIDIFQKRDLYNNIDWDYAHSVYPQIDQGTAASIINFGIALRAASSRPVNVADQQVTTLDLVNGAIAILLNITGT